MGGDGGDDGSAQLENLFRSLAEHNVQPHLPHQGADRANGCRVVRKALHAKAAGKGQPPQHPLATLKGRLHKGASVARVAGG